MAAVGANTPIMSLGATAALIVAAALVVRPSRSFAFAPSARHGEKTVS